MHTFYNESHVLSYMQLKSCFRRQYIVYILINTYDTYAGNRTNMKTEVSTDIRTKPTVITAGIHMATTIDNIVLPDVCQYFSEADLGF